MILCKQVTKFSTVSRMLPAVSLATSTVLMALFMWLTGVVQVCFVIRFSFGFFWVGLCLGFYVSSQPEHELAVLCFIKHSKHWTHGSITWIRLNTSPVGMWHLERPAQASKPARTDSRDMRAYIMWPVRKEGKNLVHHKQNKTKQKKEQQIELL